MSDHDKVNKKTFKSAVMGILSKRVNNPLKFENKAPTNKELEQGYKLRRVDGQWKLAKID